MISSVPPYIIKWLSTCNLVPFSSIIFTKETKVSNYVLNSSIICLANGKHYHFFYAFLKDFKELSHYFKKEKDWKWSLIKLENSVIILFSLDSLRRNNGKCSHHQLSISPWIISFFSLLHFPIDTIGTNGTKYAKRSYHFHHSL